MGNIFGFYKRSTSFYGMWHLLFVVSGVFSAADSVYVLYFPMKTQFASQIENTNLVAASLVCVAYLIIVDFSLMKFLPTTLAGLFGGEDPQGRTTRQQQNLKNLYWGTLLFCVFQTASTISVTLTLRHSSAEIATAKPVTTDIAKLKTDGDAAQSQRIAEANAEIKRIQAAEASAVSKAGSSNRELTKLVETTNNGWARGKIREAERDAASPFKKQLAAAQASKATILNDPTLLASIGAAARVNDFNIQSFERKTASFAQFLMYLSIISTLVMWYSGGMMGFHSSAFAIGGLGSLLPQDQTATDTEGAQSAATDASVITTSSPKGKKAKKKKKQKSVITNEPSVITNEPNQASVITNAKKTTKSVITDLKTVITDKKPKNGARTDESVITNETAKDPNPLETVQIALKAKIQEVNGECVHYHNKEGKTNGNVNTIADRLAAKMLEVGKFFNNNPDAHTPDIIELYNKALERGKVVLSEHGKLKASQPTLFDENKDKEVANG
jgi:hypothetical protein